MLTLELITLMPVAMILIAVAMSEVSIDLNVLRGFKQGLLAAILTVGMFAAISPLFISAETVSYSMSSSKIKN